MENKKIWDFLLSKIGNPYGVAGLMGNLYVESKLNPRDLEGSYSRKFGMTDDEYTNAVDNGTYSKESFVNDHAGYGLAQWTYWSRKQSLYEYAKSVGKSIGDLDMQLEFLWREFQGYKTACTTCEKANSVREASDAVVLYYEKPKHTEEVFLRNRANYGQQFYDLFAGGDTVNTADKVYKMLSEWKSQGLKKPDIVVNLANSCIGWNYVFGDRGEECVPNHIKSRVSSLEKNYPKQSAALKERCQCCKGKACSGCRFYPGGVTLCFDCRGFTYWCFLKGAGIKIEGAGATSQYTNNNNWSEKGKIANMPRNKVCCVFRYDNSTGKYEHTLIYDGNGHYIHCSGEVKKCDVSKYNATHYAIPKGLYGGDIPVPTVICQAKVVAETGGTVNMRMSPSSSATVVARVPINTIVDVYEKGDDWCKIGYNGEMGYMMARFLDYNVSPTPSTDTVTVNRAELETIYSMIGKMLGK